MIYFDYNATAPLHKNVIKKIQSLKFEEFGNPSSVHKIGRNSKKIVEEVRRNILSILKAKNYELIFTSGATESNNLFLQGLLRNFYSNLKNPKTSAVPNIIISEIEHDSIKKSSEFNFGFPVEIRIVKVNSDGFIDLEDFQKNLDKNTLAVSTIWAHNEIGIIQNLSKISKIITEFKLKKLNEFLNIKESSKESNSQVYSFLYPFFHVDGSQAANYLSLDFRQNSDLAEVDFITISGQKIYAPKGVAALVCNSNKSSSLFVSKLLLINSKFLLA
jgi:cysteine desulfurase